MGGRGQGPKIQRVVAELRLTAVGYKARRGRAKCRAATQFQLQFELGRQYCATMRVQAGCCTAAQAGGEHPGAACSPDGVDEAAHQHRHVKIVCRLGSGHSRRDLSCSHTDRARDHCKSYAEPCSQPSVLAHAWHTALCCCSCKQAPPHPYPENLPPPYPTPTP